MKTNLVLELLRNELCSLKPTDEAPNIAWLSLEQLHQGSPTMKLNTLALAVAHASGINGQELASLIQASALAPYAEQLSTNDLHIEGMNGVYRDTFPDREVTKTGRVKKHELQITYERVGDLGSNVYKIVNMDYTKLEERVASGNLITEFNYLYGASPQLIRTTLKV